MLLLVLMLPAACPPPPPSLADDPPGGRCTCAACAQGLSANLMKLAPAAGISWYTFEATKKALGVDPRT
jgi:hypothetical protein